MTALPVDTGDERYCFGRKKHGGVCRRPAGWGTSHVGMGRCKLHGGSTPTHVKSAENARIQGEIGKLRESLALPTDADGAGAIEEALLITRRTMRAVDHLVSELDSLVTEGRTHPLVAQLQQWSDAAAKVAKLGLDAGIDERKQALSEEQHQLMAEAMRLFVAGFAGALEQAGVNRTIIDATYEAQGKRLMETALGVGSG